MIAEEIKHTRQTEARARARRLTQLLALSIRSRDENVAPIEATPFNDIAAVVETRGCLVRAAHYAAVNRIKSRVSACVSNPHNLRLLNARCAYMNARVCLHERTRGKAQRERQRQKRKRGAQIER